VALSSGWTKRAVRASAHREKSTDFGVTAASTALLAGCGLPCCALVAGWAAPPEAAAHAAWRPGRCSSGARAAAQGSSARESAGAARMPPHSRDSQPATRIHSEHGEPRKHGGSAHRREEERRRRYGRARRTHKDAPATTYYYQRSLEPLYFSDLRSGRDGPVHAGPGRGQRCACAWLGGGAFCAALRLGAGAGRASCLSAQSAS